MNVTPGEFVSVSHSDPMADFRRASAQVAASIARLGAGLEAALENRFPPDRPAYQMPNLAAARAGMNVLPAVNVDARNVRSNRSITFDLSGAVMTEDLLKQMNKIAADGDASVIGAMVTQRRRDAGRQAYSLRRR